MLERLVKGFKGGLLIGIGCMAYCLIPNHYVGAALFSIGLISILLLNEKLYTGVVGFIKNREDTINTIYILIGNLIGIGLLGFLAPEMSTNIASVKLNETWTEVLFNSCACGALMYIAVWGYVYQDSLITTILAIMTFILCGFDHCIANYFYMTNSGVIFDWRLLVMVVGNAIGALILSKLNI
jgi:formate/nitrite transporter FocA (FNT family)